MDWAQILVIILSTFLAIFLLLGIVLVVLLIRITQQIKSITETAQRTASGIEGVVSNVTRFTSPSLLVKMLTKHIKRAKKSGGKK
jgi:uncharacterized protein YoxC